MKIKRFIAPNMREAMRMVREEQGEDAVILSNRRVESGIEVVAATDYDAALVQHAALRSDAAPAAASVPSAPPAKPVTAASSFERQLREQQRSAEAAPVRAVPPRNQAASVAGLQTKPTPTPAPEHEFEFLRREMQRMRQMMEEQLAGQSWNTLKTRNPVRADVVRKLVTCGIELKLAREVACELPDSIAADRARYLPMAMLSRRIPAFKTEWLDAGGVISLVGATGVGKTTTIAKLAARYVQSWGLRDVAMVTTDHFRIGAQEQLFTYGRLLGVPVLTADNHTELCQALDKLRDRKLVLIDTAGMSPRDENLSRQFAMLSGLPVPNRTALVLSASSQASDLDDQFRRFAPSDPSAVILTKLDEASRLGGAISCLIRHALPLAYTTDGQRVPEDLSAARPDQLVLRANRALATRPDAEDEEISMQFAGVVNV